jgi:hypothetical protein
LYLIPRTIQDAITVTRKIEQKFIWVDALCILQDDEDDKAELIDSMGEIYRRPILTIVAAAGQNASYGLPGVAPGSRDIRQVIQQVGMLPLGNLL